MTKTKVGIGISAVMLAGQLVYWGVQYGLTEFGLQDVVLLVVLNGLLPVVSTLAFAATLVFVLVGVLAYKEKPWPAVAGALLGTISLYVGFNLF